MTPSRGPLPTRTPGRRHGRHRWRAAAATGAALLALAGAAAGCGGDGGEGAGPLDQVVAGRASASGTSGTPAPRGCAITAECTMPESPTGFEVRNVPEGWSVLEIAVEPGGGTAVGTIIRDVVAPDGRTVRILVFPTAPGPVPLTEAHSPVAIGGGVTAYVAHKSVPKRPAEDEVHVAVKPTDRLGVLASAKGVSEDVVLAAVASILVL